MPEFAGMMSGESPERHAESVRARCRLYGGTPPCPDANDSCRTECVHPADCVRRGGRCWTCHERFETRDAAEWHGRRTGHIVVLYDGAGRTEET